MWRKLALEHEAQFCCATNFAISQHGAKLDADPERAQGDTGGKLIFLTNAGAGVTVMGKVVPSTGAQLEKVEYIDFATH